MANETLFSSVADQRVTAILSKEILLSLAARGSLPAHPALLFAGDTNRSGSNTLSIPQVGLDGYDLLSSVADGSAFANTTITDAVSTLTPARYAKAYEPSDLARWTDPRGMLDFASMARDAVLSVNATMLYLLSQMGASASTNVGSTGTDLAIADHLGARISLEIANAAGPYLAVYHGRQYGDLELAVAASTGTVIGAMLASPGVLDLKDPNNKGEYLGASIWQSNHVPSINAGADRGGFMVARGGIVWGVCSVMAEGSDQVALGPYVLFERQRDAASGLTKYVTSTNVAFAEAIDAAYTGVRTDL